MTIISKYPGRCTCCGGRINVGDKIDWNKSDGARHVTCQKPEIPQNAIYIKGGQGYGYKLLTPGKTYHNLSSNIDSGGPEYVTVITSKQTYYREDGMSFGVGDDSGYIFSAVCRPATADEAAPLIEAKKQRENSKKTTAELKNIFAEIKKTGEYPAGSNSPEGTEIIVNEKSFYGTGDWLVVGSDWIWAVHNNGMDGDNWSRNNVCTDGAGAIGHRVKYTQELADQIKNLIGQ